MGGYERIVGCPSQECSRCPCHPCMCVWEEVQAPCPSHMGSRGSCVQKPWALFTSCPSTCEPTRSLWGNEGVRGFLNSWGGGGHMTQLWPIRTSHSRASPWPCNRRGANEGPRGGDYWKRSWLVGPQSTGGQVASAAFVQGNSDVKLAETSLVIKRGEGENLQLHTSQVLSGNNNWYYNDCILLSIYYVPSSHVSPAVTHTLSHLTTLKSSHIFQLMASYNCFQPSSGHDPVVTALTNTSHFHFLWMPWAIYNENQCLNKTSKNFFNRNSKW